jgi:hypothetical protein
MKIITSAVEIQINNWIEEDPSYKYSTGLVEKAKVSSVTLRETLDASSAALATVVSKHIRLVKKTQSELKKHATAIERHSFMAGKRRGYLHSHFTKNYVAEYQREQLKRMPKPEPLPTQP